MSAASEKLRYPNQSLGKDTEEGSQKGVAVPRTIPSAVLQSQVANLKAKYGAAANEDDDENPNEENQDPENSFRTTRGHGVN
ncbi:hypothetical protein H257_08303 [Aphanomyces astaci]|uniref:Uncharacterized protein n=1 Tax=Aphanomyces astaci TaxID=112090 RepID=W4GEI9_APHAT|nr:hypothetical protein H257_08303 [Aphanomyces astaci]ETV78097.1 hypothetical protein H257_08303 [Aphanomyces astaci]|eukprot:XP_009832434.1 hypothetical protein H257_08303 [Aphanomyces astaci]